MSGGKRQNQHGFQRKRDKQAERRRQHADKYADRDKADQINEEADRG